uniref:Lipocalin/cytosolic fatty-acid binding domain-containing protein n=1 Tax=Phaeomonas parva TaxID=124430 RepID=A0A6U4E747_9STRA|mmetsp:Transcript_19753/g.59830  ORF Transcript_19753/g.59830 Transcript_19753/m.59830 type:complete len:168 (+) Transcript_19753:216-719(+)
MGSSASRKAPLQVVKGPVDIQKFMGDWYVIGVKPTAFEVGAHNALERYSYNGKTVDVDFTFNYNAFDGKLKSIPQTLFPDPNSGNWKASPFWPIKMSYLILELPEDYSYTVVGYPDRSYVWIMARQPTMDDGLYEGICNRLVQEHDYDLKGLVKVPQRWDAPPAPKA